MKYGDWLDEWLEYYVKPSKKTSTYVRYESAVRLHIRPRLGNIDMIDLNGQLLQKAVIDLFESGNKYNALGLAPTTVCQVMRIVQSSLNQAAKASLLDTQHINEICAPRTDKMPIQVKCFTEREQKLIEEYILKKRDKRLYGILIALYTGLRIGELLALTWADVDFKHGQISVSKTCRDSWGGGYSKIISSPKTHSSYRAIPIPKQIVPYLRELKRGSKSDYVLSGHGDGVSVRSYQRTFARLLKRVNVRHLGFHSLRHTFATRAIENSMDIKMLSEVMGHKNPAITLAIYAHSLTPHKKAMMNKLGRLLNNENILLYDDEDPT